MTTARSASLDDDAWALFKMWCLSLLSCLERFALAIRLRLLRARGVILAVSLTTNAYEYK